MNTRPTTDRVKESIFNIISNLLAGAAVLDLFAGSGSLGIEALSRGARQTIFCDKDLPTTKLIKKNLSHCKLEENSVVLNCDFMTAIKKFEEKSIDIVFLDPPYSTGLLQRAIKELICANILTSDAIIIAEHPKAESLEAFNPFRTERYGDICISFIKGAEAV